MKKLLAVLVSLSIMAGSAFARGTYNGDVQLHIGTGADSLTSKSLSEIPFNNNIKSNTFDFDIASWHLFSLNNLFSVGFMVDFNGGIGGTKEVTFLGYTAFKSSLALHFNGLIGPAVGFTFGNISALNISAGLAFGSVGLDYDVNSSFREIYGGVKKFSFTTGGVGFGTEINAKFFPKSSVSPLIGFRFAVLGANKYDGSADGEKATIDQKVTIYNTEFFAGIAFNF